MRKISSRRVGRMQPSALSRSSGFATNTAPMVLFFSVLFIFFFIFFMSRHALDACVIGRYLITIRLAHRSTCHFMHGSTPLLVLILSSDDLGGD